MSNLARVVAITTSALAFAGCNLLAPKKTDSQRASVSDPDYKKQRASEVKFLPKWQDQSGVAPRFAFWNLVNRCKKYDVEYKATIQQSDSPFQIDKRKLSILPRDYMFYSGLEDLITPLREYHGIAPVTIWVRKQYSSGMKQEAAWIKTVTLDAGSANQLEVGSDCKSVEVRDRAEPIHPCYHWLYSSACRVPGHRSDGPTPEPEQCTPDRYGVEGDMSKSCEYETPEGMCRVRYAGLADNCVRR